MRIVSIIIVFLSTSTLIAQTPQEVKVRTNDMKSVLDDPLYIIAIVAFLAVMVLYYVYRRNVVKKQEEDES